MAPISVEQYHAVREQTERLCAPLAIEDYVVQAMADVSPAKWHLAHTTWFFETFVLEPRLPGYRPLEPRYRVLFNSYYDGVGPQFERAARGRLSRPTVAEIYGYRAHVDKAMAALLDRPDAEVAPIVELGLCHEQQHQELLLTDLKYNLGVNPLRPAYHDAEPRRDGPGPLTFIARPGGVVEIGHDGTGFAFDNEAPRHRVWLEPFALASRLVTNGEYRAFVEDGGYRRPELWLSEGWKTAQAQGWQAPLYWERDHGAWQAFTLAGMRPLDPDAPVVHVSYYEADAYARWRGQRLPTEAEWEVVAADPPAGCAELFDEAWQWTASAYLPYPGFHPLPGAVGEYNGKFMMNQMVLRGGSRATPPGHSRPTYRNFFPPDARWQFSGLRLAGGA